jgi:hypothetical protein
VRAGLVKSADEWPYQREVVYRPRVICSRDYGPSGPTEDSSLSRGYTAGAAAEKRLREPWLQRLALIERSCQLRRQTLLELGTEPDFVDGFGDILGGCRWEIRFSVFF